MKTSAGRIGLVLLACAGMLAGCTKKMRVTISNHSAEARRITVTCPDGTLPVGAVSAGGRFTHTLAVKAEDLPAQCTYSAGMGVSQSFTVSEDTKDKLWFRITKDGQLMGPYTKDDVHVETEDRGTVKLTIPAGTVIE